METAVTRDSHALSPALEKSRVLSFSARCALFSLCLGFFIVRRNDINSMFQLIALRSMLLN